MYSWLLYKKRAHTACCSRRVPCQRCCPVQPGRAGPQTGTSPSSPRQRQSPLGCFVPTPTPLSRRQSPRGPSVVPVAWREPSGRWSRGSRRASPPRQRHPAARLGRGATPGRGDARAGNPPAPGHMPALRHCLQLLPLPSAPFLPPFPRGPNSRLCCSINIITIIILSLDT